MFLLQPLRYWSCVATLPFTVTQARNTSRTKRKPSEQRLVIEYLRVYPEPSVGLTPPPGSFSTVTCAMGRLKPQQISQTGIFTSPLCNPITPAALKSTVCRECDRSKSSPNSKSVDPTALGKAHNNEEQAGGQWARRPRNDWTRCFVTFQVDRTKTDGKPASAAAGGGCKKKRTGCRWNIFFTSACLWRSNEECEVCVWC